MTTVVLNTVTRKVEVFSSARDVHARAEIADHKAAADPHPQYLADADLAEVALSGDAGDLASGTVPDARMPNWTGYNVASRTALEAANVPAAVDGLRLLGHAAVGDGGGAHYKRVASEPGHPHKIQSADGAWWEELFAVDVTVNIPSDFATLQEAIDRLSKQPVRQGARIILNIESGHALTAGFSVSDGDYSKFTITSDDAEVTLDAGWTSGEAVAEGEYCRMPNWGILVNCAGVTVNSAIRVTNNSSLHILDGGNGARNASGTGLFVYRNSQVTGSGAVFTGCTGSNVWVTHVSFGHLENGNFSGSAHSDGNVFVSRGSTLYAAGGDFSDSATIGLLVRRSLVVAIPTSRDTKFDNNGTAAIFAANGATIIAHARAGFKTAFTTCNVHGVIAQESGAYVNVQGASFANVAFDAIRAFENSIVVAKSVTMTGIGRHGIDCISSRVYADGISIASAGGASARAQEGGDVIAPNASFTNSTTYGVQAVSGSRVALANTTVTGSGTRDIEVSNGSIVTLTSGSSYGTATQGENIVTGAGLILNGAGADVSYHRGNILGTVSQSGGVPTGSTIERGSNAFGTYVRFADGTQICTRSVSHDLNVTTSQSWSFAATFADTPVASHGMVGPTAADVADWYTRNGVVWAGSTNAWQTRAPTGSGIAKTVTLQLTAIGRWF
jgi:hypothetical protein